jgi:regulator of replication initiation timing
LFDVFSKYKSLQGKSTKLEQELTKIQRDVAMLIVNNKEFNIKVPSLDKQIQELQQLQTKLELQPRTKVSYEQAEKILAIGGSAEDLISSCGLSQAEAELLVCMQQQKAVTT